MYKSKLEAFVANCLYNFKISGQIINYEYNKRVCEDRMWTCDFYVVLEDRAVWIEVDGLGDARKERYDENNEKFIFYKTNAYDVVIVNRESEGMKVLERIIKKPNLMNRKKEWVGQIDFPKTNNIQNITKDIYANDLIVWNGNKLDKTYLRSIDEDARDEIAKDLLNFFFEFDFIKDFKYRTSDIDRDFGSLKKNNTKINIDGGMKYLINTGTCGYKVYRHFFPNIIKVGGKRRKSIYDVVTNKKTLWDTIRNRIGNTLLYGGELNIDIGYRQFPMPISPSQICIGAKNSGLASMASIFKPHIAKAIYSNWVKDGNVVLDYSAGFGGRLLGLMTSGLKEVRYLAYEPNTETYDNLIRMIDYFGFNAEIKKCGSEEVCFDEQVDFAFSSPPYFDFERYCDEDTQCYIKYPNYDEWLERYWKSTTMNIRTMLKNDGTFAVNVGGTANEKVERIERDVNRIIRECGFELIDTVYMKTTRSHLASKKNQQDKKFKLEGIFFYRKL